MKSYYTVVIPWEPDSRKRTKWHPTDETGPFSTLTCGVFYSLDAAAAWAYSRLGCDATFRLRHVDICPLCGEDRNHPTQPKTGHSCTRIGESR